MHRAGFAIRCPRAPARSPSQSPTASVAAVAGTPELQPGDTVILKSGGPVMTIENIITSSRGTFANCSWFEGVTARGHQYRVEALEPYDPNEDHEEPPAPHPIGFSPPD